MGEYKGVFAYTAGKFITHVRAMSKDHMAEYHAKKERKKRKAPLKGPVSWKVMPMGALSLIIRKRKPPYLLKEEYSRIVEEMVASEHNLTHRDLDDVIKRRTLKILEKEPPCTKVKIK